MLIIMDSFLNVTYLCSLAQQESASGGLNISFLVALADNQLEQESIAISWCY